VPENVPAMTSARLIPANARHCAMAATVGVSMLTVAGAVAQPPHRHGAGQQPSAGAPNAEYPDRAMTPTTRNTWSCADR
jgi:hypothetical protein